MMKVASYSNCTTYLADHTSHVTCRLDFKINYPKIKKEKEKVRKDVSWNSISFYFESWKPNLTIKDTVQFAKI